MANTIVVKRSTVGGKVPLATDLQVGELAVNVTDKKIYSKNAGGTVVMLSGDVVGPATATDNAIARFDLTTGELIQNSTVLIDDNGNITGPLSINMADGTAVTVAAGRLWYNATTGSWNLGMGGGNITQQVGEELFFYGKASSAISDTNLQIVYQTGVVGASGVIQFAPTTTGITNADLIIGVATESIALNAFGRVTSWGIVHGIDTTGTPYGETWANGDVIWYNPVTGNPTKTKPVAPNIKVQIGVVINAGSGGSGSFSVEINHGSVLGGTDSNVQLTSPASGNLLVYDATAGYWKNAFLSAGTGISVTNGAGSVTVANTGVTSITGTASQVTASASTGGVTLSLPSTINVNTSGTAANVTGTVAAANGGTGLTSPGASGNVLTSNGTTWVSSAPTGGGGGLTYVVKNSNYTASDKQGVLTNTSAGSFTVTLPASPTTGMQVVVADDSGTWGTNNLIVGRNGATIAGAATDLTCDISGVSVQLVYDGTTWAVFVQAGSSGGTAGSGTVSSVSGTGTVSGISLSGTVTTSGSLTLSGTLAVDASNFSSQTANTFLAAPNGTAGVPTFRTIAAADVPTLNQDTTGTAANVTGTVAIANGGSGQTTAQGAMDAFAGAVTSGSYLRGNGTHVVMSTIQAADVPTLNQNTTGTASNVTGTVAIANGGTGQTTAPAANAALNGFTTTATAGGTTTLTNTSSYYQIFTGTSAQTISLPSTATLTQGWSFHIVNNSTGTLTVQTSTAVSLGTIPPGITMMPSVLDTTVNTAAAWETGYTDFSTLTGTGSNVLSNQPTITGLTLAAGTTTVPPIDFTAGTLMTTPAAGTLEYDGVATYLVNETTAGRGYVPNTQTFRLTANGSAIGNTISNFYGTTSNIPLVSGGFYEIEILAMALRGSTAGTATWTLTNSAAPTLMVVDYEQSPLAGMAAPPGSVTALTNINFRGTTTTTTAAYSFTTGTLAASVNHYFRFKIYLRNGTGTSLKIQMTAGTGNNSMTPLNGSVWFCRRLPDSNTGAFAA